MYTNHTINRKLKSKEGLPHPLEVRRVCMGFYCYKFERKEVFLHEEMLENKNYLQKEYAKSLHEKVLTISQNM